MKKYLYLSVCVVFFMLTIMQAATTGKLAGRVTDVETDSPLAGANVILQGTMIGAATDMNGYYSILNIIPGSYDINVSMIGYAPYIVKEVRVEIDLTTTIDVQMKTQVLEGETVVVVAQRKVIKQDLAASQKSVTAEEIETLPVSDIGGVLGLKAGITSDLSIRGGNSDETMFMVDGIVLRDERNNTPISSLPLSAMQEVSVRTGGFGAEYSNVRSGVVNVVTKEGGKESYSGTMTVRYSPPAKQYFGDSPFGANSYWLRSYLDDAVCWTGTNNGAWDAYTMRQNREFAGGWNEVSRQTLQDDDPTNDLTPAAAQRLMTWQYRKKGNVELPDRTVDLGFGGPVPFLSSQLGDLRFYISHRNLQNQYMFPLSRDGVSDQSTMLKVTSDLSPSLKLTFLGIYGEQKATTLSRSGGTGIMGNAWDLAGQLDRSGFTVPWRIYTDIYWSQSASFYNTMSLNLSKVVNPGTFYKVQIKRDGKTYHTAPMGLRDTTKTYELFPGYFVDEAPLGFWPANVSSVDGGIAMGGAVSTSRDRSEFTTWTAKFDYTSQLSYRHLFRTGLEFIVDDYAMEFGMVNEFLPEGNTWTSFKRKPFRLTGYLEDKIEYEGFITTLGLVPEYVNSNGKWYDITSFERSFLGAGYSLEDEDAYKTRKVEPQFYLSPRLGISHPITVNSKLYFNYGHYRQMPVSERQYRIQRSAINQVDYIGDPSMVLARTVSYELGYEHALFNMYLMHLSAYYKDISNEENWVRYISIDGKVNYYKLASDYYRDIRGFEVELTKMYGQWLTGMINYEYRVGTTGYFGVSQHYENPAEQREYLRQNPYQSKPVPRPRLKSNLDFHTPAAFGPQIAGQNLLGGWHLNFIVQWTAGFWSTWNPQNIPGIEYNVQYRDYSNVDLKVSKLFRMGKVNLKFFVDVNNLLNQKYWSDNAYVDSYDYNDYMYSLHLPEKITDNLGYNNIPGNDRPGDRRKQGVAFQPMEAVTNYQSLSSPKEAVIYYSGATKEYVQYSNGAWAVVEQSRLDRIMDDRAYIDMPNQTFLTFLDTRDIYVGLTLSFDLR